MSLRRSWRACSGVKTLLQNPSGSDVLSGLLRDGSDGGQSDARRLLLGMMWVWRAHLSPGYLRVTLKTINCHLILLTRLDKDWQDVSPFMKCQRALKRERERVFTSCSNRKCRTFYLASGYRCSQYAADMQFMMAHPWWSCLCGWRRCFAFAYGHAGLLKLSSRPHGSSWNMTQVSRQPAPDSLWRLHESARPSFRLLLMTVSSSHGDMESAPSLPDSCYLSRCCWRAPRCGWAWCGRLGTFFYSWEAADLRHDACGEQCKTVSFPLFVFLLVLFFFFFPSSGLHPSGSRVARSSHHLPLNLSPALPSSFYTFLRANSSFLFPPLRLLSSSPFHHFFFLVSIYAFSQSLISCWYETQSSRRPRSWRGWPDICKVLWRKPLRAAVRLHPEWSTTVSIKVRGNGSLPGKEFGAQERPRCLRAACATPWYSQSRTEKGELSSKEGACTLLQSRKISVLCPTRRRVYVCGREGQAALPRTPLLRGYCASWRSNAPDILHGRRAYWPFFPFQKPPCGAPQPRKQGRRPEGLHLQFHQLPPIPARPHLLSVLVHPSLVKTQLLDTRPARTAQGADQLSRSTRENYRNHFAHGVVRPPPSVQELTDFFVHKFTERVETHTNRRAAPRTPTQCRQTRERSRSRRTTSVYRRGITFACFLHDATRALLPPLSFMLSSPLCRRLCVQNGRHPWCFTWKRSTTILWVLGMFLQKKRGPTTHIFLCDCHSRRLPSLMVTEVRHMDSAVSTFSFVQFPQERKGTKGHKGDKPQEGEEGEEESGERKENQRTHRNTTPRQRRRHLFLGFTSAKHLDTQN